MLPPVDLAPQPYGRILRLAERHPRRALAFARRLAGKAQGYDYSPELKNSNIVWNEETLDKWLTNPEKLVPGTKMFFDVESPQDRADIIAFLKEKAK